MKKVKQILCLLAMAIALPGFAQVHATPVARTYTQSPDGDFAVFNSITKYLIAGDAASLSSWFADSLDVTVSSSTRNCSRNQARQIVKNFFDTYTPRSFEISHKASNANMKYALGYLNAGGEQFLVTIFVNLKTGAGKDSPTGTYQIQQLKIERQTGVY